MDGPRDGPWGLSSWESSQAPRGALAEAGEEKPPAPAQASLAAGQERLHQRRSLTCSPRLQWSCVERPGLEGHQEEEEVEQGHSSCSHTTPKLLLLLQMPPLWSLLPLLSQWSPGAVWLVFNSC